MDGNGRTDFWFKVVGMIGAVALVVGTWVWGASELTGRVGNIYAEVDNIKRTLPPAGSLTIIQDRIEQQGERIKRIEQGIEQQAEDRRKMMELMMNQWQKVDKVLDTLMRERRGKQE